MTKLNYELRRGEGTARTPVAVDQHFRDILYPLKSKPWVHDPNARYNGVALKRHCESAHNGQFDDNCNACKELKAQIK